MKNLTLPQIAAVGFVVGVVLHACAFSAVLDDGGPTSGAGTTTGGNNPVAISTVAPTATVLADRTDCDAIRGSDYRSVTERQWFLSNC